MFEELGIAILMYCVAIMPGQDTSPPAYDDSPPSIVIEEPEETYEETGCWVGSISQSGDLNDLYSSVQLICVSQQEI